VRRPKLSVSIQFEPTRIATEVQAGAYEMIFPVQRVQLKPQPVTEAAKPNASVVPLKAQRPR
jgi:hypothetical protein